MKKKEKKLIKQDPSKTFLEMPVINPRAAGIDVGSRSFFVCVGQGPGDVREFGIFTCDLHDIAKYLKGLDYTTVAMESTGFYWKQLFVLLHDYGLEVILVNVRHIKNVKGRKTDVVDSRWIQLLHSLGLLSASFQPDIMTEELRTYTRQRQYLLEQSAREVLRINKNLTLMNLQLKPILRDLVGLTGRKIIEAIIAGIRDPFQLAELIHPNCHHSKDDFIKALEGNYRDEYIFELNQCYDSYQHIQKQINQCDSKISSLLEHFVSLKEINRNKQYSKEIHGQTKYKAPKKIKYKNCPPTNLAKNVFELSDGIELLNIPGVNTGTILCLVSEIGLDLSMFKTAKHFCSWLGLAPNNKITGGKILSSHTEKKKNRMALAFRDAANAVERIIGNNPLKSFLQRIAVKKGRSVAITATARKIATIVWVMLTRKVQYNYKVVAHDQNTLRNKKIKTLQRIIQEFKVQSNEITFHLSV